MLRIMSLFRDNVEPTRFERSEELKPIAALLATLRKKEAELNRAKRGRGAESVDFEKYTVVARLLAEIDHEIDVYNAQLPRVRREDEVEDMVRLVAAMETCVNNTLRRDAETLRKFRDFHRQALVKTVDWGLFATSVAAIYMMPVGWLFRAGLYVFVARPIDEGIMNTAGLNEDETRSMIILRGLQVTLHRSYINLRRTIHPEFADQRALANIAEHDDDDSDDESGLLFLLSPGVQQYVESMRGRQKNRDIIDGMHLSAAEEALFNDYKDPITLEVMDVPVRLEEDYFDLESLLQLPIDGEGARTNPLNRNKFYARDIQPCRAAYRAIRDTIEKIQTERQAAPAPRP